MPERQMPGAAVYTACPMVSETTTYQIQTPGGPLLVAQAGTSGVGGAVAASQYFLAI